MSLILKKKCCCFGCFRLAVRCPCSPDGPGIAIRCADILAHPGKNGTIVLKFNGICYSVSLNSPVVDPMATDPPLVVGNLSDSYYEDCAACCVPAQCWYKVNSCNCANTSCGTRYVLCSDLPAPKTWMIGNCCYTANLTNPVNSLPPGAMVVVPPPSGFVSCAACCAALPQPGCPPNLNNCPDVLTVSVGSFTMFVPVLNCLGQCPFVPSHSFVVIKNGLLWQGNDTILIPALNCPGGTFEIGYIAEIYCVGGPTPVWEINLNVGYDHWFCHRPAFTNDCPQGAYSIPAMAQCGPSPSVTVS